MRVAHPLRQESDSRASRTHLWFDLSNALGNNPVWRKLLRGSRLQFNLDREGLVLHLSPATRPTKSH